ncbi:MAG: trpS, partial [Actinobacteria bacterium]|nr:trpS [Actinomycetota bacterium]
YKEVFAIPQAYLTETPKIMGTDNRKMSKTYGNAILLSDTAEEVWSKVRPMVTDPARERRTDPGNPEICNLFSYHKIFSDEATISKVDAGCRSAGIGCIECKKWMYERIRSWKAACPSGRSWRRGRAGRPGSRRRR